MASAFKPTYTRPIPKGATITTDGGKEYAEYIDGRGRKQRRPVRLNNANEKVMVCEQRHWWMRYTLPGGEARRERGYVDRQATEQEAARREKEAAQIASGFLRVKEEQLNRPIVEHLEDYLEDRNRRGLTAEATLHLARQVRRAVAFCGWTTLRSIESDGMMKFLGSLKEQGFAPSTINMYLQNTNVFLLWCIQHRRMAENPIKHVQKTATTGSVRVRRALTENEVRRLLEATGAAKARYNTSPTERQLIYLMAVTTGLRKSELTRLEWRDIVLDGPRPRLNLRAETTKSRRADTLPLRPDVAAELSAHRASSADERSRVFSHAPQTKTFQTDRERAGIPRLDEAGRHVDFHCLRYTFGTMLAKNGVHPRVAMKLMRHADVNLTMKLYTDPTLLDPDGAVGRLPCYTQPDDGQEQRAEPAESLMLRPTGTDDEHRTPAEPKC